MLRPTNTGATTSALFEMKKGVVLLVRQDQQNDAQIFVSFLRKCCCQPGKTPLKKGAGRMHLHETGKRPVRIGADALKQQFASMV